MKKFALKPVSSRVSPPELAQPFPIWGWGAAGCPCVPHGSVAGWGRNAPEKRGPVMS